MLCGGAPVPTNQAAGRTYGRTALLPGHGNDELTDNGRLLLERCEFLLEEAQKTYDSLVLNMQQSAGLIRVCMFRDLYDRHMKQALLDFADTWPDIRLELTCVEHPVDMRTDPYDVAFLIGPSIAEPLVARKLMTIEPLLYTAPSLFERYPVPAEPADLHKVPCIVLQRFGRRWTMHNNQRHVTIEVEPRYMFSSVDMCCDFAQAGHGVMLLRGQEGESYKKAGRLVRVLPEWNGGFEHDVHMVTGSSQYPRRIRLFLDHIREFYTGCKHGRPSLRMSLPQSGPLSYMSQSKTSLFSPFLLSFMPNAHN